MPRPFDTLRPARQAIHRLVLVLPEQGTAPVHVSAGIPAHTEQALAPTAIRNCPHCEQPVTIVALLATPEAARPSITNRVPDITPLRRTP
jgi:hypothetical protein